MLLLAINSNHKHIINRIKWTISIQFPKSRLTLHIESEKYELRNNYNKKQTKNDITNVDPECSIRPLQNTQT